MAQHSAKFGHTLRARTAIGGALTAGVLLTAPVAVPLITGVAQAQPSAPSDPVSQMRDALKGAMTAHQARLAEARTTIRTGVTTQNLGKVTTGVGQIRESNKTFVVQVQGILRGSLATGNPE